MNICKWCGREAKHQFKITGEYCCSRYPQQCPEFKKKLSDAKTGKKRSKESVEKQSEKMKGKYNKPVVTLIEDKTKICEYGCGKIARYRFKNGKYCCEDNYRKCEGYISSKNLNGKTGPKPERINEEGILCSYGCGRKAKYKFKNGNYCCEKSIQNCPSKKKPVSKETRSKLRKINRKPSDYWKETYPLFYVVEKPKFEKGKIFVRCKNESCKKWFEPTYVQIYERIRNIEREDGGGDYFYCSEECKNSCPIFNQKKYPKNFKPDYSREVQPELRLMRLEIDNHQCQKCHRTSKEVELQCHHVEGINWEPLESADIDKVITLCKDCHIEVHSKEGCTYHEMRC